jgi:hypothetical protein
VPRSCWRRHLDEAKRAASLVVLDAGRTLASGTPDEIVARTPGTVGTATARPDTAAGGSAWRCGTNRRVWIPEGATLPPGMKPVAPDLEDA